MASSALPTTSVGDNAFVIKFNPATSTIIYSTYLGGANGCANALDIAVDSAGNAVVVGDTCANTFPLMNPLQSTFAGSADVFVTKLNATGSGLIFSTYLGGWHAETSTDVAIGASDSVHLTGWTLSSAVCGTCAFPTTAGAYQTTFNGGYEAFATKISATGTLVYSTFLGRSGDEQGQGIAVDASGDAVVTGTTGSAAFPTLNAAQPSYAGGATDAFVSKLNATGTGLIYSTFLGGSSGAPFFSGGRETAQSVAIDSAGNAYVTGLTPSTDFPTLNALQPTLSGCVDNGFLVKFDPTGTRQFATYLGGGCADVVGESVALDSLSNIYVSGSRAVTKINSAGTAILYSYLFPSQASLVSIAVDSTGRAYVAGGTDSTTLPIVNGFQPTYAGVRDAFFAIIGESNNPPSVNAGGPYSVTEGGLVTVAASGFDPDGNALSYVWDLDNNGSFETTGQSVSFSAATLDGPSTSTIRVQVTDTGGLSAISQGQVSVLNAAPTAGTITAPSNPLQVNTVVNVSAGFTDAGILDTHTALWDWDDGGTSAGTVNETNGSGTVSGHHTFTTPGIYTLSLTIQDNDGATAQTQFRSVVVYDPAGGFVTGGGWINSPAGAWLNNPALVGKANFGFSAKYKKGANVPDGQFNFQVASLNFHSTGYDWLVVAGAKAKFKGTGKINGSGNYGFMLTAIDGQLNGGGGADKFRIKIWDKNNGGAVVYDNQVAAPDDAVPSMTLGGGSIVIHKP